MSDDPAQDGLLPLLSAILTDGVNTGFIVIVILLEVAVAGLAQANPDVMMQVTICPFVRDEVVYVALFVPTLLPLTCH